MSKKITEYNRLNLSDINKEMLKEWDAKGVFSQIRQKQFPILGKSGFWKNQTHSGGTSQQWSKNSVLCYGNRKRLNNPRCVRNSYLAV